MRHEVTTAVGTPNIALVKYWGKRDDSLNLPMNSSISMTLDEASMNTKTSILFTDRLRSDELYINMEKQDLENKSNEKSVFIKRMLDELRGLAGVSSRALIVSQNNFPTAAGLASSASGAATLAYVGTKALGLELLNRELSILARKVSGSACRGLVGGFSKWKKGTDKNGSDSYAYQIADENHWPEVIDIVTLIRSDKKKTTSSAGHKLTVDTSELYNIRPLAAEVHAYEAEEAIRNRDFARLAELTIRDSNQMHATMLDTWSPVIYLEGKSLEVIKAIYELNRYEKETIAAPTFDAGPNAQIITLEKHKDKVLKALEGILRSDDILIAKQGGGPRLIEESFIDEEKLMPRRKDPSEEEFLKGANAVLG